MARLLVTRMHDQSLEQGGKLRAVLNSPSYVSRHVGKREWLLITVVRLGAAWTRTRMTVVVTYMDDQLSSVIIQLVPRLQGCRRHDHRCQGAERHGRRMACALDFHKAMRTVYIEDTKEQFGWVWFIVVQRHRCGGCRAKQVEWAKKKQSPECRKRLA
jgi:hypothetical protein